MNHLIESSRKNFSEFQKREKDLLQKIEKLEREKELRIKD